MFVVFVVMLVWFDGCDLLAWCLFCGCFDAVGLVGMVVNSVGLLSHW